MIHDPQLCVGVIQEISSYSWTSRVTVYTMRPALHEWLSVHSERLIYTLVLHLGAGQSRRMGMFKKLAVEWENVLRVGTVLGENTVFLMEHGSSMFICVGGKFQSLKDLAVV